MAQKPLGHSDVKTINNIYVNTDDEQVSRSAKIPGNAIRDICDKPVVSSAFEKASIQQWGASARDSLKSIIFADH
jgi:hypothetical protein